MAGLNLSHDLGDNWSISLDAHHSSSQSGPGNAPWGGWADVRFGANVVSSQRITWDQDIPSASIVINDDLLAAHNSADGVYDARDIGTQVAFTNFSLQTNTVDELRLSSQWDLKNTQIKVGLESGQISNKIRFSDDFFIMGDWGIRDPSLVPDEFFTAQEFFGEFSGSVNSDNAIPGFVADATELIGWAEGQYPESFGEGFVYSRDYSDDRKIKEHMQALYFQVGHTSEVLGFPYYLGGGLRYVDTEVDSRANVNVPSDVVWLDSGDFDVVYAGGTQLEASVYRYQNGLPNIHLNFGPEESWLLRLGYSHSMARADYAEMNPEITNIKVTEITSPGQYNTFAEAGNPKLEPLKSKNMQPVYQLKDASSGPRAQLAREQLTASPQFDGSITNTDLFNQIAATENNDFSGGANTAYYGDTYDIYPLAEDPKYQFTTTIPGNNKRANIWGFEYALQVFPGSSGFGFLANYTSVDGDIGYGVETTPESRQFALLGLSDSMNLILIYESSGFQTRVAYNWRGEYLQSLDLEPTYVEAYSQVDFMLSYAFSGGLTWTLEGLNIFAENSRSHGRSVDQLGAYVELQPRYLMGVKYPF